MGDTPEPTDLHALAERILGQQPFSRVIGARVVDFGNGSATFRIPVREELKQQHGFLHGGLLATAADMALTFAGGATLGPNVLTSGFTIDFVKPAQGVALVARARVVHAGSRHAVCVCELSTEDEQGSPTLVAVAQGTIRGTGG